MSAMHLIRQSDLIPTSTLSRRITFIGAGAIGSHASLACAKMGMLNQMIWDFDSVTIENMNNQGYPMEYIGKLKVDAMKSLIKFYTNQDIDVTPSRYQGEKLGGIVVSSVDSMASRKVIWGAVKNSQLVDYLIDPRMSAEYAVMYIIDPKNEKDIRAYENTLFDDSSGTTEPCTAKATIYCASMIAALVCKGVKNIITKQEYPRVTNFNIAENHLESWKGGANAN